MSLISYLKEAVADRREFAAGCGTTMGHLNNVAYRVKSCAPLLALRIERASGGKVGVADLHPELARELEAAGYVRRAPQ